MDTDIALTIIKAMAQGIIGEDDTGHYCLYCNATEICKDIEVEQEAYHERDCPIILARQLLHDMGTPMNIYKMTGMRHYMTTKQGEHWQKFTGYTLAVSEEDAITNYSWASTRDLQATFVRTMPLDLPRA